MRREQAHELYELEKGWDNAMREETQTDPMEEFGKWLERYEAEHGEYEGLVSDLIPLWENDEDGEAQTLALEL